MTQPNTSILESGLNSGIALPFSCANGSCGDCRAKLLQGTVEKIHFHDFSLTEAEKLSGVCLLCAYAAQTDVTIEASEAVSVRDIPHQQLRGKLCYRAKADNVSIVRFKLIRGKALRFLPGQNATITTANGQTVSLPIANCPCDPDYLEFHIPDNSPEAWSELTTLGNRERVDIEGPFGSFTIDNTQQPGSDPLVFIALGIGFATIKPLLEHVISLEQDTPCQLIWISTGSVSQYLNNLCRSWNDAFDSFTYTALDSTEAFNPQLITSYKGIDTRATTGIYISGEQWNIKQIKTQLEAAGVDTDAIATNAIAG